MNRPRRFQLLVYMVAAAAAFRVSSAFNIDVTNPDVSRGEKNDFFGYKVLQFNSSRNKGIIVTAPLRLNGSGGIFSLDQNQTENWFHPDEPSERNSTSVKHLGLSIAADHTGSHFTVCSPSLAHECQKNSYLNSLCYDISDGLQEVSSFRPLFQKCTKQTVNLVFLFDGSGSMTTDEFNKNKDFITEIMHSLKNSSIKFAAVQFSITFRTVFDFKDYDAGRAYDKLMKEEHMKNLTNTHRALEFVLKNLFEDPAAGGTPEATKAVVIITDGDPSDSNRNKIIEKYEQRNIIRIVIGVKDVKIEKFKPIASEPKDSNVFKIENYAGLQGLLENFQNRIFNIEGASGTKAKELTNEMSQSGFSAAVYKDTLILGSVGSNIWRGSLYEHQTEKLISDPEMEVDSYMGYSLSVGEKNGVPLYFAGAPRFNHMGQVVLFTPNGKTWSPVQRIKEDQIGSYFGAELRSVDVNSDGDTDFLMVGAPQFYQPHENKEGRIYIYSLSAEIELKHEHKVTAPSTGRFGTTISSLSDLNGDGLRDVAVGAPLEDDNRGVVYIYLGDESRGIRSTFSQRIPGRKLEPEIRFFGLAIDGGMDLGDDGLPDVVFGSQGAAVVLRSKPVFNVKAHLSFHPAVISIDKIDCVHITDETLPLVTITTCFKMEEATKSKAGAASSGLNISYTLNIDPTRPTHRGFFFPTQKDVKTFTRTYELVNGETCFNDSTYMPKCVRDTLSPINIKLNFSQADSESAGAILNIDSRKQADIEVPFEKHCRTKEVCIAQLEVDFNFTSKTLLVSDDNYFYVSITLMNKGDDSYNTSLTMYYPLGLSFSRMSLTKSSRPTLHTCGDLEGVLDRTVCGISFPVYRSGASATFLSTFRVAQDFESNDTISMTVTGKSDDSNGSRTVSVTKRIPVQFEIRMALTVKDDSDTYLNFTADDASPKDMVVTYRIDNTGFKEFPVNVSLFFPTKLQHNFEVISYHVHVQSNKSQCSNSPGRNPDFCSSENSCVIMKCDTFILERYSHAELSLVGKVQFKELKQQAANMAFLKRYTGDGGEVKFRSFMKVDYDKEKYVLASQKQETQNGGFKQEELQETVQWKDNDPTIKQTEVRVEFFIPPHQLPIISTGAGLGLLLLIIITVVMFKLGCFKRKTMEYYQEQDDKVSAENGMWMDVTPGVCSESTSKSETDKNPEQLPEEKQLL